MESIQRITLRFWAWVAAVRGADASYRIALVGLTVDLITGILYNVYDDAQWSCDGYYIGNAVAATCYTWALLKYKRCVLFEFALALYTSKLLMELFGDPTETNLCDFLLIAALFLQIKYRIIQKFINGRSTVE
ncbi:MAG: hypothetical protein ACRBFS_22925 [Aureispira sp.]